MKKSFGWMFAIATSFSLISAYADENVSVANEETEEVSVVVTEEVTPEV